MTNRSGPPTPRTEPWLASDSITAVISPGEYSLDGGKTWTMGGPADAVRDVMLRPAPLPAPALPQYAARDAACDEWVERIYGHTISWRETMMAKTAFCAGWSARKQAQYQEIANPPKNNLTENLDLARQDVQSIFPTEAELTRGPNDF